MVEQCFLIRSLTWEQPLNSLIYWANGCATAETNMRLNVFTGGRVKIGGMYCVCVGAINMTLKMTKRVVSILTVSEPSSHHVPPHFKLVPPLPYAPERERESE